MIEPLRQILKRRMRLDSRSRGVQIDASSAPDSSVTTLERARGQANPADIGRLRRERRRLLKARERSVRDLGGLTLEMVRRETFKPDLLKRRARDILGLEDGVHDVQDALADAKRAIPDPGIGAPTRCACGSSNDRYSTFCAHCGRSLKQTSAVSVCEHCTAALPGGAEYCPACGTAAEATRGSPTGAGW